MIYISIIIPLYNSDYIEKQLFSIMKLDLSFFFVEFIFIDDGSYNSYILSYKKLFYKYKNLNIVYKSLGNKDGKNRVCEARNLGAKLSKSENLIFLGQDTILHKKYLFNFTDYIDKNTIILGQYFGYNNLEKHLEDNDIDFFIENGFFDKQNFDDFRLSFYEEKELNGKIWEFFGASNFFMKKDIFQKMGGFDESITFWGDEDVEFGYRLQKAGYKIHFDKNIKVLNLSEKLYSKHANILETDKIESLSNNWLKNYKKHQSFEYKNYIFDRFINFEYSYKNKVSNSFQRQLLSHCFYSNGKNSIVFRIDDVNYLSTNLVKIISIFLNFNYPITLGVEPNNLDKKTLVYLKKLKCKYNKLLDIVQHGYKHINYSDVGFKYEFGENRRYEEKYGDIEEGYNIMDSFFGEDFTKAFIPPFNNYDLETEKIIGDFDFKIISSGYPNYFYTQKNKIIQLHCFVDLIKDYNNLEYKTLWQLIGEIDYYLNRDLYVGIIFHPQFFCDQTFELLIKLLYYIKFKKYDTINFSSFLNKYSYD